MTAGGRYGVEIRAAQPGDAAEVARLLAAAAGISDASSLAGRLDAVRSHPAAACLVSTSYTGLSGVIALSWAPVLQASTAVAQVTAFVVDPEDRRLGIGRLLLKAASQAARSAGCGALELPVPLDLPVADAFCRNTGFSLAGAVYTRSLRKKA